MKKRNVLPVFLFACLSFSLIFYSCVDKPGEEENPKTEGVKQSPLTAFTMAYSHLNITDQKAIFNGLSPAMKAAIWKNRLESLMKKESTDAQTIVLKRFCERLSPGIYIQNSSEAKSFTLFVDSLFPNVLKAYGSDSLRVKKLFTLLGDENSEPSIEKKDSIPKCNCNIAADTTKHFDCWFSTCKSANCVVLKSGCGFFWQMPCDGLCL